MGLADVHAHLTHHRLAPDVGDVLARAPAAGATTVISNGLNPTDNEAVLALARRHSVVRPAFGLYPVDAVLTDLRALGGEYPRAGDGTSAEAGLAWGRNHVTDAD